MYTIIAIKIDRILRDKNGKIYENDGNVLEYR